MVRKRDAYTRGRDRGRKRKPRRPPGPGLTITQLTELTKLNRRTIADYTRRGLLTAPPFRGTSTRYQREHLLRIVAITTLKASGIKRLKAIHSKLQAMGNQELDAWLRTQPLRPEVAQALGMQRAAQLPITHSLAAIEPPQATETWQRLRLLPGLELAWKKDNEPLAQLLTKTLNAHLLLQQSNTQKPV